MCHSRKLPWREREGGVTKKGQIIEVHYIHIGSPMVCGWIWFLSNELFVFYPRALKKKNNELDKNPIQPQTMEDSFYHMLQHYFYFHINFMKPFTCKSSKRHFNSKYVIIHALCCHVIAVRGIWILWIIII